MLEVNKDNFEKEVANSDVPVLIDFWAPWCVNCKTLMPHLEKISEENANVKFVKVNVDEDPEIASKYKVMGLPTIVLLKDNEAVLKESGSNSHTKLKNYIQNNF